MPCRHLRRRHLRSRTPAMNEAGGRTPRALRAAKRGQQREKKRAQAASKGLPETAAASTQPPTPLPEGANCGLQLALTRPPQAPLSAICCTKGPSSGAKSPISGYALGMHGMYSISPHLFANKLQTNRHANSKPGHGCAAPARLRRAQKPANRTHPPTPHGQKNPRLGPTHPPPRGQNRFFTYLRRLKN